MRVWYPGPCALNHSMTSWSIRSEISSLLGTGFKPLLMMPRTTCDGSNSGCSVVAVPLAPGDMRRDQSVLDFTEEALRLAAGRFAEGDDADFIFGLCVRYGDWHASQETEGNEALFTIVEAIVFVGEGQTFEDSRSIHEVKPVLAQVDRALALGPRETHALM